MHGNLSLNSSICLVVHSEMRPALHSSLLNTQTSFLHPHRYTRKLGESPSKYWPAAWGSGSSRSRVGQQGPGLDRYRPWAGRSQLEPIKLQVRIS